jgi:hypothetical protein
MNPEEFSKILKSLGIRQVCDGCGFTIDPTVCGDCGQARLCHDDYETCAHFFMPKGCKCPPYKESFLPEPFES